MPSVEEFVAAQLAGWTLEPPEQLVLEPGRSLVGRAGVTLYTVGSVKEAGGGVTYVAVDGGMSDNPRPQLYDARLTALLADRADEPPDGLYAVSGKHCESGDLLIGTSRSPSRGAATSSPSRRPAPTRSR